MFEPVSPKRLYEDVVNQLLAHIRAGRFAAGADLPSERELAEFLEVGRPAIREALHSLQERGIVEIRHGKRAQVLKPSSVLLAPRIADAAAHMLATFGDVRDDVLEARILFETGMARLAAQRATEPQLAQLRQLLADNRAAIDHESGYLESDLAVHRAIATFSGNALFAAISDGMLGWLRKYHEEMVRVPGASRVSHREHAKIVERIVARDADGASIAMERHLRRSNAYYRSLETTASEGGRHLRRGS